MARGAVSDRSARRRLRDPDGAGVVAARRDTPRGDVAAVVQVGDGEIGGAGGRAESECAYEHHRQQQGAQAGDGG